MIEVIIIDAPITERYWSPGDKGLIHCNEIRVGGCWFKLDERWKTKPVSDTH